MAKYVNRKPIGSESKEENFLPKNTSQSRYPFYLMIHPRHSWSWNKTKWVPEAARLVISPGVANTPGPERGQKVNPDPAILGYQKKGFRVLLDQNEYLSVWPREGGGNYYTTKWDTAEDFYGVPEWSFDREEYSEYLLSKVVDGTIPEMHPRLKQHQIEAFQKRVDRLEKSVSDNPLSSVKRRYEEALVTLEAMKKDLIESKGVSNERKTVSKRSN